MAAMFSKNSDGFQQTTGRNITAVNFIAEEMLSEWVCGFVGLSAYIPYCDKGKRKKGGNCFSCEQE
jgi:hypothetical protein